MRSWNELSMAEKADVMKLAIEGGVYDLDSIKSGYNEYAKGGKIHIKPENRGKFTALKERTGHSATWFKEHGTPAQKKMATFALNARKWKHEDGGNLFYPGGEITYGQPYYSYDENGKKIDDTLNYNAALPEIIITPDSKKSPAERAVLERERRRNHDAYYGRGTYNAKVDREQTELEKIASQKAWENSIEKQALDYAQAAASGIGIGADIVSGLPIYSSLKGAKVLSEAETPMDYAEGALWLAPIAGVAGREAWNTGKQAVSEAITKGGFTISTPYLGKTLGKTTAWIPTNRNPFKGISWMVTGKSTPEGLPVEYITSKYSGEGRKLYDEGIKLAQNQGDMGLLVGDNLLSAPKSYSTYEHWYPNRVYVDDQGFWTNRNMVSNPNMKGRSVYSLEDFLAETKSHPDEKIMFSGAPRYRLETPSTAEITAENAASIVSPQNEGLVVSALPDYRGGVKTDYNLFRRFAGRGMPKENVKSTETIPNNMDLISNILLDPDKRFMMFEPGKFVNHDIGAMSVEEVVNTFGPEAEYYKKLYDVAKAHNFEGKYAKIGQDAEYNILNRFAINKTDPDVAKGIAEARDIYDIPEYRARFYRWGTLGDTFVDDALARIDDVKLQGLSKEMSIKGQHGVHGGAYTSPDATTIGITNSDSSSWITDMVRHETNHVGHGLKRQPDWMRYHNEKIRPVVREGKTTNTPLDKYYDEMDEIVERSKTAIEYANKIRKEGETLDQALTRLADMTEANIYNAEIPADIRQSIARYTKDSMLNFWKNFVGGYAAPIGLGLTGYGLFNNQEAFGGKIKKRKR